MKASVAGQHNRGEKAAFPRTAIQPGQRNGPNNPLDTAFFDGGPQQPVSPHPSQGAFSRWLTVEQVRKMQRMRRQRVIEAIEAGELPFEQRGRIRYVRLSDVLLWEERRLTHTVGPSEQAVDPDFADLAG